MGDEQVLANYLINARTYAAEDRSVGMDLTTARSDLWVYARGRGLGMANGSQEGA